MKIPMSWLNDYTDVTDITPAEYAHAMTMSGSKVEGIENPGSQISNVVTGKILDIKPHENSDHLVICMVDVGDETLQIVTGAPNVKTGQVVPVAKHNSRLPGGVTIKKGKLRGVESNGMLCSHDELGLSAADLGYEPEYGILVLPEDTPAGIDIKDYFGLNEDVVEFEITSNRPDCFSVIGLARETAVTFKKPFRVKKPSYKATNDNISDTLSVEVKNTSKCLRYSAKMIKNVKIGPSPKWLSARLRACGIRSINNIVDITNYILLEYGQPMHAFDLRDLEENKITVRNARAKEVIKTLDGQDRTLDENDLVISDGKKAVAIAGVMGGFNSEVKPDTTTVIFESATFEASTVRLTAQKIGLRTESSSRYEKGLDANNTVPALERACELVQELGCGEVTDGMIDIIGDIKKPPVLDLRPDKINAFLGTDIPTEDMVNILKSLEFKIDTNEFAMTAPTVMTVKNYSVTPPSFRPDIECEADVAEEIARFYGYDKIPTTLLSGEATTGGRTPEQKAQDKIKAVLTAQGAYEIFTYTFTSPSIFDKLRFPADSPLRTTVKISNPLGEDTSVMRTTTIASMLDILSRNYNQRAQSAKLFEIGKIYLPKNAGELPDEPEIITLGMYGGVDFYDLKGCIEELFSCMNIKKASFEACCDHPSFHPGRCAKIFIDGKEAGIAGEIHPSVSATFEIGTPCYIAELDFSVLFDNIDNNISYTKLPKFPAVTRDIAVIADKSVPAAALERVIVDEAKDILDSIKLFDVYEGEQIPEGKKSLAYAVSFRAPDRSLTNDEVNPVFDRIVTALKDRLGAELR